MGYPNFGYDLQCAQKEAYSLMNSDDLCYDRYTTPLAYSLWYQARRKNVFVSHFLDKIVEACTSGRPVEIFDLGAGTGCVQFCFGLALVASIRLKNVTPLIRIINVDSSPFMLNYLRSYLWPVAVKYYPELKILPVEYHVYSWSNKGDFSITNPWLGASYLFDSSENEEYLLSNFDELIRAFDLAKVLLLTSAQQKKRQLMNSLSLKLRNKSYQLVSNTGSTSVFQGELNTLTAFRQELVKDYNLKASASPVIWADGSYTAVGLERNQSGFAFDTRRRPQELDIFNPPLRVRRDVQLNDAQKKAARFETSSTVITGPAGCGKSIIVTEKIINILEQYGWQGSLQILVTTFNISLLKQLRSWVTDLITARSKQIKQLYYRLTNNEYDGTGKLMTGADFQIVIEFVHFEMLAKQVGNVKYIPFDESVHVRKLSAIVTEVREELQIPERNMRNILTPEFLIEEYHRIIYGMQCRIKLGINAYLDVDRTGRGKRLDRATHRPAVWKALHKYATWMANDLNAGQSFMARRQLLYNGLLDGSIKSKYDYLFVDEFQDCTRTDSEIKNMLLHDTNRLVLAGDMAQAVHIGQSGFIPKDPNRKKYRLKGSYRLPFLICEAIYPLSREINIASVNKDGTAEITPYNGAPPGARPLFVYADNHTQLAANLIAIKNAYAVFDLKRITIMEKDEELCKAARQPTLPVETTTILRLKGLEKEFVVWSLQADIEYEDEVMEFAYTIMTRTNCMLIIASTRDAQSVYKKVLPYLRPDRIIFWDFESENSFKSMPVSPKETAVA